MLRAFGIGVVFGVVAGVGAAGAQIQTQTQTGIQQMPPRPAPLGAPPRDARPTVTGTSVIRGRIFAADTSKPLRRARITVNAPELGEPRTTSTNVDGKYEIRDLPAGRYNISVSRSGYLQLRYGQRRPFEQGKQLQLGDHQAAENVDFTLPRMSLITGRIYDEAGEPISGVRVLAMRSMFFEGRRRLVPVFGGTMTTTDDAGQYRILGLSPGSYYISADTRETWTVNEGGQDLVMGYGTTYFPGVLSPADGRRVTVGVGQELANQDFALVPGRGANISGTALDSLGRPAAGKSVGLVQELRAPNNLMMMGSQQTTVGGDGTFTLKNVTPGEYKVVLRGTTERDGGSVQETAVALVAMNGVEINNLTLMATAGWSFTGRIVTASGDAPTAARDRFRVAGRPLNSDNQAGGPGMGPNPAENGRVKDDWTFSVTGLLGPVRVRVTTPDDWIVSAIHQEGRDVTDGLLEGRNGEALANVVIVVSNKASALSGTLVDEKGGAASDGTVIVFAADAQKWSEDSRFVKSARPDQDGKFVIRGLPAGDYLAVAIDYVEEGMWNDPEYLEMVRRDAQPLALADGEGKSVSLKVLSR